MTPPTASTSEGPDGRPSSPVAAAHVAYHVRMSAVFAVAGQSAEGAAEAVLAWTILATAGPDDAVQGAGVAAELLDRQIAPVSEQHRTAAVRVARARAMDIGAHYVTTGQHAEAELYAQVADDLDRTLSALVD